MNKIATIGVFSLLACAAVSQETVLVEVNGNKRLGYTISGVAYLINGQIPEKEERPPLHAPGERYCTQLTENMKRAADEVSSGQTYYLYSLGRLVGTARVLSAKEEVPTARVTIWRGFQNVAFPLVGASLRDLGHKFNPERFVTNQDKDDLVNAALAIIIERGHPEVQVTKKEFWKRRLRARGPDMLMVRLQTTASVGTYPSIFLVGTRDKDGNLLIEHSDPHSYFDRVDQLDVDHDGTDELMLRGGNDYVQFLQRTDSKWKELFSYSFMVTCS